MTPSNSNILDVSSRRPSRPRGGVGWSVVAWIVVLLFVAPAVWLVLLSLRSEVDTAHSVPQLLAPLDFHGFAAIFNRGIAPFLMNSLIASVVSVIAVVILSIFASYSLAIDPVKKSNDVLFFFLSTKFLPLIGILLPMFLIIKRIGVLDNIWTLVVLYTVMNLPIGVWLMTSFMSEIPREIVEAAQVDGASMWRILSRVVIPISSPGIAAVALISFIFSWNEFLFAVNFVSSGAATAPVFLVGFITSQGLFLAKLSAASIVVSAPVLVLAFIAQDKLVSGLSLGAVKG